MSPSTWVGVMTETSTAGGYLAGPNAWAAGVEPRIWGLRVQTTPEVVDGTAIIGGYRTAAQLFRKGGVAVQATNAHADFFIKNMTAIRAEIRVALAVYRPQAFGLVTGLPVLPA
jgi:HK97 family phage major capsid protein